MISIQLLLSRLQKKKEWMPPRPKSKKNKSKKGKGKGKKSVADQSGQADPSAAPVAGPAPAPALRNCQRFRRKWAGIRLRLRHCRRGSRPSLKRNRRTLETSPLKTCYKSTCWRRTCALSHPSAVPTCVTIAWSGPRTVGWCTVKASTFRPATPAQRLFSSEKSLAPFAADGLRKLSRYTLPKEWANLYCTYKSHR